MYRAVWCLVLVTVRLYYRIRCRHFPLCDTQETGKAALWTISCFRDLSISFYATPFLTCSPYMISQVVSLPAFWHTRIDNSYTPSAQAPHLRTKLSVCMAGCSRGIVYC